MALSKELRERLGVDDIALVLQQNRLRWYGHVLRKDDDHWVKKCMEHEVEFQDQGEDQRRPGKRLNKEDDAMVSGRSYIMQQGKNNRHSVVE